MKNLLVTVQSYIIIYFTYFVFIYSEPKLNWIIMKNW